MFLFHCHVDILYTKNEDLNSKYQTLMLNLENKLD